MLYLDTFALTSGETTYSHDPTRKKDHIVCLKDSHIKSVNWDNEDDGIWHGLGFDKESP